MPGRAHNVLISPKAKNIFYTHIGGKKLFLNHDYILIKIRYQVFVIFKLMNFQYVIIVVELKYNVALLEYNLWVAAQLKDFKVILSMTKIAQLFMRNIHSLKLQIISYCFLRKTLLLGKHFFVQLLGASPPHLRS